MFAAQFIIALLAFSASFAFADVNPSAPGPGAIFNADSTCSTSWDGDQNSTTIWKNMAIELMTGSNFDMIHLTTVATNQDGTVAGNFTFPCPEVNPYSAIYFFQYSSPQTSVKTWTTRFTIASPSGQSVPPANATQPGSNQPIPWGVGALLDISKAVPAPGSGSLIVSTTLSTPGIVTSATSSFSSLFSSTFSSLPTAMTKSGDSSSSPTTDPSPTGATTSSSSSTDQAKSAALSMLRLNSQLCFSAAAILFVALVG